MLSTLSKNLADSLKYYSYFPTKQILTFHANCLQCQILFSRESKKYEFAVYWISPECGKGSVRITANTSVVRLRNVYSRLDPVVSTTVYFIYLFYLFIFLLLLFFVIFITSCCCICLFNPTLLFYYNICIFSTKGHNLSNQYKLY